MHDQVWFERNLTQLFFKTQMEGEFLNATHLISKLTPREKIIACLASQGMQANKIGENLFATEKTIRNQLSMIYSKLNVKNHVGLCLEFNKISFCESCLYDYAQCSNKKVFF